MGLSRQNFFTEAEFHGGTALRILHGLQRFSEDLDFALLKPNTSFTLIKYLKNISDELRAFGYEFEIKDRSQADTIFKKAFLKDDSIGKIMQIKRTGFPKKLTIKLEVDSNPPAGAETEIKYLNFPAPFGITAKTLPSSFSGKLHALLCRTYIKGRDWYDFLWYVAAKTPINFVLLKNALQQQGPWKEQSLEINASWVVNALHTKIEQIDWNMATRDISPFIQSFEQPSLQLWNKEFFLIKLEDMKKYLCVI